MTAIPVGYLHQAVVIIITQDYQSHTPKQQHVQLAEIRTILHHQGYGRETKEELLPTSH